MGVDFLPHAVGESIGGIDEDEVEAPLLPVLVALVEPAAGVAPDQRHPLAEAESLDVSERRPGVAIDQDRPLRAARQRLDRQRPGPAVEVEDEAAADLSPRAEKIASRTRSDVGRTFHPRGATRVLPPSSPAITRIAQSGIGSAAPAPNRRPAASRSGPSSGAASEP